MTIGERIKARREELGLSQDELAHRLGYKSRSSINKIELNQRNLTQSKIKALADALSTTPSYVMGWDAVAQANKRFMESDTVQQILAEAAEEEKGRLNWLDSLSDYYGQLNDLGLRVAIERIEELTHSPKYQRNSREEKP